MRTVPLSWSHLTFTPPAEETVRAEECLTLLNHSYTISSEVRGGDVSMDGFTVGKDFLFILLHPKQHSIRVWLLFIGARGTYSNKKTGPITLHNIDNNTQFSFSSSSGLRVFSTTNYCMYSCVPQVFRISSPLPSHTPMSCPTHLSES